MDYQDLIINALDRPRQPRTAFSVHKAIASQLPDDWDELDTQAAINELIRDGVIDVIKTRYPHAYLLKPRTMLEEIKGLFQRSDRPVTLGEVVCYLLHYDMHPPALEVLGILLVLELDGIVTCNRSFFKNTPETPELFRERLFSELKWIAKELGKDE